MMLKRPKTLRDPR